MDTPRSKLVFFLILVLAILLLIIGALWIIRGNRISSDFNSSRAMLDVEKQVSFGPRTPGSEGHDVVISYISNELKRAGWMVEIQDAVKLGHPIQNIVAKRGSGSEWIILGAHYDSRFFADHDEIEANHSKPVPGANDGASGVAVLLELARTIPPDLNKQIWLVFFDNEDQGKIEGWEWILGSQAFVETLQGKPNAVVIVDMIGDADLNIYKEKSSDPELLKEVWLIASELGFGQSFINEVKYSILDDHIPFIQAGIPAIDIIDIDYPYYHTTLDTVDKVSSSSLEKIGMTLLTWLTK